MNLRYYAEAICTALFTSSIFYLTLATFHLNEFGIKEFIAFIIAFISITIHGELNKR